MLMESEIFSLPCFRERFDKGQPGSQFALITQGHVKDKDLFSQLRVGSRPWG